MELPEEAISYQYQTLLLARADEWTPAAELQARHYLNPARLKAMLPVLMQVRSQVAAEREMQQAPPEMQPLQSGFIDLPRTTLDQFRRKNESSVLGRVLALAAGLREQVDHVVILGAGGSYRGRRRLFGALCHTYHNELPPRSRPGVPRIYFAGNDFDNDALNDLLDLLQAVCVDPELREERWGVVVVSKSGDTLEAAAALRAFRREAAEYYGNRSPHLRRLIIPVTGSLGKLRNLCIAEGWDDEDILTIPDNVGGRYSVLTPAGLLPAAVMGLDVCALLLGAASMTLRFLEEPFDRNPVLQFAAVNHLMAEEGKSIRVLSAWSRKLEGLGLWYDHLLAESLGKQGRGPTPLTMVAPRDLHGRGQQHQEGTRDRVINHMVVKTSRTPAVAVGMADRNEDDLNALSRKTLPDLLDTALECTRQAHAGSARPSATLLLPVLTEHTMGQVMQMLMLATVVEAHLMGINPYGQPGAEAYRQGMRKRLTGKNPA